MSSILEALRKLDRERTERREGVVNIEREILKSPSQGVVGGRRYLALLLTLFCSVIILCLLLIFVWWRPFTTVDSSSGTLVVRQKVPVPDSSKTGRLPMPQPTSRPPTVGKQEPASSLHQGDAVPRPSLADKERKMKSPTSQSPPKPAREVPAAVPVKPAPAAKPAPAVKPATPAATPQKQQKAASQPLPRLSVTGIAFREDRSSRLAIVNGEPLVVGETIEGVRVEDILEDQILFSFKGRKFSLSVGESTQGR